MTYVMESMICDKKRVRVNLANMLQMLQIFIKPDFNDNRGKQTDSIMPGSAINAPVSHYCSDSNCPEISVTGQYTHLFLLRYFLVI